jgi:hypothetical protein
MSEAMKKQSMKARITQHDFEARTGGRITYQSGVDFVAQVSKKHRCHYIVLGLDAACEPRRVLGRHEENI